jgi:hypothetical protein
MIKNLIIILAFFTFYIPKHKQSTHSNNAIKFNQYIKSLNYIPLPFSHSAKEPNFTIISPDYNKAEFEKFKYKGTVKPLGILFNENKYVVTVDLSIGDEGLVPFLVCFDKQGNKLDSLGPYQLSGGDDGYEAVERLLVTKDKRIKVADTIKTWKDDSRGNIVSKSIKTSIGVTYYLLTAGGKFIHKKRIIIKKNI